VVKGDEKIAVISLASIIAKVVRDKKMTRFGKLFPEWNFERHKGYGTRAHIEAMKKYGLTELHRRTFLKNLSYLT
jgi:ribonuclease HII